ncbi:MAG: endopeptidase La [Desulfovibrionaceae bacterium]|nr:endopeptidase La [Desulfovibrionaceae bacterium]
MADKDETLDALAGRETDDGQESLSDAPVPADDAGTAQRDNALDEDGDDISDVLPVLSVRDVVVFNSMILPLFIGREKSVRAVEAALERGRHLMICTQRQEDTENPGPDDLYTVGTVVNIMRMLKMPDGRVKVLAQGVSRARIEEFVRQEPFLEARVDMLDEATPEDSPLLEALLRTVREQSEKVLALRGLPAGDISSILQSVREPGRLADLVAANIRMAIPAAQEILEASDAVERLQLVNRLLQREVEVAAVQARIQHSAKEGMDKAQKEFFLREQMKAIRQELGEGGADGPDDLETLAAALQQAGLPDDVRREADKQLRRLRGMHGDSSEANIVRSYLECLAELPWKNASRDRLDIPHAANILDEDHLGLDKAKERILEFLSVRKLNPGAKGAILCFAGPPGVGKTSLGKSIARALGRRFQRLSLGGLRDEAEIRGHRRTYVGAMPGRIIQAVKQAGTRNPVIVLDEVDKLGTDFRGDPSSALLEVLDPEQNNSFSDHYLNVPFDLSRVMFICTANRVDTIPGPLRDRMELIEISGYTAQEKAAIARAHLLPRALKNAGLKPAEALVEDDAIERIIREYTREAGLRNLEREISSVCRKLARKKAEGQHGPFRVDAAGVEALLGAPRYLEDDDLRILRPGMALGLAWTPAGGEVLAVEAAPMPGKGGLLLTGQLGDVMKESAQLAQSYIRSRGEALHVEPHFFETHDLHVHVPAGATPKDGPSAGVALTTALISAITGRKVRGDTCMTGEITLQGRVLPVGGIKEKILAGVARGLRHALLPRQNLKDLEEIPADLLEKITVHPVGHYDEVFPLVFEDE